MRQVVSLVKDGHVNFALVDDEEGELVPFAEVLLPYPDRFGLHESALLGTNLINAIGLNGKPSKSARARAIQSPPPALSPAPTERPETDAEKKRRYNREYYHRNKNKNGATYTEANTGNSQTSGRTYGAVTNRGTPRQRALPDPKNKVKFYISADVCWEALAAHPEGLTAKELAQAVWTHMGQSGEVERWAVRTVENRISMALALSQKDKTPPPFIRRDEQRGTSKNGQPSRVLFPNPMAADGRLPMS